MFLSLNTKHCFPCSSVWYFSQNSCTRREVKCRKIFLSSQVWNREYLYKNQFTWPILFNFSVNTAGDLCLVKTVPFCSLASLPLDFADRSQSPVHDFILCCHRDKQQHKLTQVHCRINDSKTTLLGQTQLMPTNACTTKYCAEKELRRKIRAENPFLHATNVLFLNTQAASSVMRCTILFLPVTFKVDHSKWEEKPPLTQLQVSGLFPLKCGFLLQRFPSLKPLQELQPSVLHAAKIKPLSMKSPSQQTWGRSGAHQGQANSTNLPITHIMQHTH